MKITVLTLFPGIFSGFLHESLFGKALANRVLELEILNLRVFSETRHLRVDDTPYGGGPGMLLRVEPIFKALHHLGVVNDCGERVRPSPTVLFPSPAGSLLRQPRVKELALASELIILCGHYEGVDGRVLDWVDDEVSLGDYVFSGGELAAMVLCDAVARLLPGFMGNEGSPRGDSFFKCPLLEAPQYTKPREFLGKGVPEPLLSGDHQRIAEFQREASLLKTARVRPELLPACDLTPAEQSFIARNIPNGPIAR